MSPARHQSVLDAFADALEQHPERIALHLVEGPEVTPALSYADLYADARRAAAGLAERGLRRGDRLLLALPTSRGFFAVYLAALASGIVPIVVPRPARRATAAPHPDGALAGMAEMAGMAGTVGARFIVVSSPAPEVSPLIPLAVDALGQGDGGPLPLRADASDVAHLQATSGSTGLPRLAVIRHGNLAANVRAIGMALDHRAGDVLVTWLPLFHDMGIVGVSYAWFWQCPLVATDPSSFVRNPISWLRLITRFRGTLSPAPNSAYQMCARVAARRSFAGLDLASWRVALCGAEPVHESTLWDFTAAFQPYGFRAATMMPVYGLAEATLAVTMFDPEAVPRSDEIDADALETAGRSTPAGPATRRRQRVVSLGRPVPGHRVRIGSRDGAPRGAREVGEIEVAGPSIIDGYAGADGECPLGPSDGYLRTGDLGYLVDGELYVTGRLKDIIIVHGRNISPAEVEAAVEPIVEGGVAAFGAPDPAARTEALHLIIESAVVPRSDQAAVETRVREALESIFGLTGFVIHWSPRRTIPRTSSGKVQRFRCRELAERMRTGAVAVPGEER